MPADRSKSVLSYYGPRLALVLRGPHRALGFAFAAAVHAAGHALMALVAGAIALSLAQRWGLRGSPSGALADKAFELSLVGLAVVLVKGAAGAYTTFVQAEVAGEVGKELRLELLDALLAVHRLHRPRHEDHGAAQAGPTAQAVVSLTERVREVEAGLDQGLLGGGRAVAQLVPIAALLLALSARMAGVALVVLACFAWVLGRVRAGYQRATHRAARERERLVEAADESVRYADLWVTYGAEAKARTSLRTVGEAIARSSARLQVRATALSGGNEVLGALALVAAIGTSRAGWLGGVVDGGTLLAFAVAFFLAYRPMRELADSRLALARAQGAYEELRRVTGAAGARVARTTTLDVPKEPVRAWPLGALELRALRLARGSCGALSVRIEPGTVAVIMGATGAGKTTLLRTLLGLERAQSGDVLFGGERLGDAPAGPGSRPFAWVPQDAPLLADTLAANVGLGASGADTYEALAPLGAAHLAGLLDTSRLGVGGRAVSGGERQWIALARAIATRQPVLLLDEPTSGLDAVAQRRVLEAITRLRGRRTVLLVTHRPEPLAIADTVVRLEAGGVEEKAA
jgi:ABC-type multidrug transport system fused ATPase/permease subunit